MRYRSVDQQLTGQGQVDGQAARTSDLGGKNPAAVELGRRGGLKGGAARAAKLTAEERSASARKAAAARWSKPRD